MREAPSKFMQVAPRVLTLAGIAAVTTTLVVSAVSTLSLEYFEDNITFVYFLNAVSIVVLLVVIAMYMVRFWRRIKGGVAGTHLAIRFLRIFAIATLLSLSVVYCFTFFSIRGLISGWVDKQVKETVSEASQLRELFVASIEEKVVLDLREYLEQLESSADLSEIPRIVFDARNAGGFQEITYFSDPGSPTGIIASSAESTRIESLVPINPTNKLIEEMLSGDSKRDKEPVGEIFSLTDEGPMLRLLIPVRRVGQSSYHYLQVIMKLSKGSERLAEQISSVKARYDRLVFLRKPVQINFVLTLTLVTLVVLLLATWMAIKLTNRLVQPIQALSEGTRKVAAGNYEQPLAVTTNDDLGVLVDSFNDMTRKIKTSQEKIEEQRSYLEIVLQNLSSGVLFINYDTSVNSINLAAASILDVSVDQFQTFELDELMRNNPQLTPLLSPIRDGIRSENEQWNDTVEISTERGTKVLTYSTTRISAVKREHVSYVVVVEDITDLVLVQRFEAWSEVAKKVSHELLNPLQPIRLAVDRIKIKTEQKLSGEDNRSLQLAYSSIDRQLDALIRIVRSMRDYANLPAIFQTEPIDLNVLIEEAIIFHFEDDKQVQVNKILDPDLPKINADPQLILQVMNNILINSRQAGQDSKSLIIEVETKYIEPDGIMLKFADNGPGFDPEILDHVFELFQSTKQEKGSGLGLSIVKKIVDGHGGEITVTNRTQGGAEITIILKRDESPKKA